MCQNIRKLALILLLSAGTVCLRIMLLAFGSVCCLHPHGPVIITNLQISIYSFQHPIRFYLSFPLVFLLARPFKTAETGCTWAHIIDIRGVVPERAIGFCSGGVERFLIRPTRLTLLPQFVAGWCGVSQVACRDSGGSLHGRYEVCNRPIATVDMEQADGHSWHWTDGTVQWTLSITYTTTVDQWIWSRRNTRVVMEQTNHCCGHGKIRSFHGC
jgi:hypothetical protein